MSQPGKEWRRSRRKIRGLGDVVAIIATPIAAASDAIFHTALKNCANCHRRQEQWNRRVPFEKP